MLRSFVLNRVVHRANSLLKTVALLGELVFSLCGFDDLSLEFVLDGLKFATQVFDLSVFAIFDELELVLRCFELALQLALLFLPGLHLTLEQLNLVFKVVHMNFHLVLEPDMSSNISL